MKLYRTHTGVWHGTQKDAGKPSDWEAVDVPVDKAGLLDFLNEMEKEPMNGWQEPLLSVGESEVDFDKPTPRATSPLNLAPLKHGAGWRESVAGMSEAIALMSLPTALRWAQAALERVGDIARDGEAVAPPAEDNGDDLI